MRPSINVENKDSKANLFSHGYRLPIPVSSQISRRLLSPRLFRLPLMPGKRMNVMPALAPPTCRSGSLYRLNIKGIPSIDDNASANRGNLH
ncbi:hypothetical protein KCP75_24495 [Salmonella enterica subsp. enterica]|nr:hypothetical protein KCP75_24495 [Salmonella enterica subsp. enterica]